MSRYQLAEIDHQIKELQAKRDKIAAEMERNRSSYDRYTETSFSGQRLLKEHNLSEYGVWKVFGEDPNCDLGGSHREPELGLFEGTLEAVIRHAVELPGFWQWGSGGRIEKAKEPAIKKL